MTTPRTAEPIIPPATPQYAARDQTEFRNAVTLSAEEIQRRLDAITSRIVALEP